MDVIIIKFLQVMKCIEGYKIIVLKLFCLDSNMCNSLY
jgi:hypothetical protein